MNRNPPDFVSHVGMPDELPSQNSSPEAARENELRWVVVRENMRRFAAGEKMFSVFDLARGY